MGTCQLIGQSYSSTFAYWQLTELKGGLYVLLEPVAGSVLCLLCLAGAAGTNYLRISHPLLTNQVSIGVFVVSWILQFIGHGTFEGRAPALLDNLFQAVFLAPLFVWLELLFLRAYFIPA